MINTPITILIVYVCNDYQYEYYMLIMISICLLWFLNTYQPCCRSITCTYKCIYIYIYIYTYVYMCTYIYIYIYICWPEPTTSCRYKSSHAHDMIIRRAAGVTVNNYSIHTFPQRNYGLTMGYRIILCIWIWDSRPSLWFVCALKLWELTVLLKHQCLWQTHSFWVSLCPAYTYIYIYVYVERER